MKKYLLELVIFLLIFVTAYIFVDHLLTINVESQLIVETNNNEVIIIGHSHPQCAFNDSLIEGFTNLSNSGESYFYSYARLHKIIKIFPKLKTVFVEFTNNQIDKKRDEWIWEEPHIVNQYSNFAYFIPIEDKVSLLYKNPIGLLRAQNLFMKKKSSRISLGHFEFKETFGGFLPLNESKVDSILEKKKDKANNTQYQISQTNIDYLKKIISLCAENEITVILVRTPQHPEYELLGNELEFQKILNKDFEDLEFLDFNNFPLSNHEFADLEHLNSDGAQTFSLWFNELLKEGLLNKNDMAGFVQDEILKIATPVEDEDLENY